MSRPFLVVGVPTVRRPEGRTYLPETLNALLREPGDFRVVVADCQVEGERAVPPCFVSSDDQRLTVFGVHVAHYPSWPLQPKEPTGICVNDPPERTLWRSKQAWDALLTMKVCHGLGEWFIHVEDDCIARPGWFASIKDWLTAENHKSAKLARFCDRGYIGHCYHESILIPAMDWIEKRWDDEPIDWLMDRFPISRKDGPCLFDHRGYISSLPGQTR